MWKMLLQPLTTMSCCDNIFEGHPQKTGTSRFQENVEVHTNLWALWRTWDEQASRENRGGDASDAFTDWSCYLSTMATFSSFWSVTLIPMLGFLPPLRAEPSDTEPAEAGRDWWGLILSADAQSTILHLGGCLWRCGWNPHEAWPNDSCCILEIKGEKQPSTPFVTLWVGTLLLEIGCIFSYFVEILPWSELWPAPPLPVC